MGAFSFLLSSNHVWKIWGIPGRRHGCCGSNSRFSFGRSLGGKLDGERTAVSERIPVIPQIYPAMMRFLSQPQPQK
ncbi:MAG: hypothetical protein RLZZ576_961 [Actinomycetota bacterium]